MRSLSVALLLLSVALAGCSDEATEDPDECVVHEHDGVTETHGECPDHSSHQAGNATVEPKLNATTNAPPVAELSLGVDAVAGSPVTFTINVTDSDGDNVTWTFDADGDNVTDLDGVGSARANFTYDVAGTFNATLTASDGVNQTITVLQVTVAAAEAPADPNAPEDRGWYIYYPETGLCDVKAYTAYGTGPATVYVAALSGGTWVLAETNGLSGLQIENNHPARDHPTPVGSFAVDTPGCVDGDLVVI